MFNSSKHANFGRSRMFSSSNYQVMDMSGHHAMINAPPAFGASRLMNVPPSSNSSVAALGFNPVPFATSMSAAASVPNLFGNSIYLNSAPTSSQVSSCEFPTDYKPDITVYGSYARVNKSMLDYDDLKQKIMDYVNARDYHYEQSSRHQKEC